MSTEPPAGGGEKKPVPKNEGGDGNGRPNGQPPHQRYNRPFIRKEKFLGVHPDFQG
jgi:hypothetical protein